MDILKTSKDAQDLLLYLSKIDSPPDEKIAALRVAAATIENVLVAESIKLTFANIFKGMK